MNVKERSRTPIRWKAPFEEAVQEMQLSTGPCFLRKVFQFRLCEEKKKPSLEDNPFPEAGTCLNLKHQETLREDLKDILRVGLQIGWSVLTSSLLLTHY